MDQVKEIASSTFGIVSLNMDQAYEHQRWAVIICSIALPFFMAATAVASACEDNDGDKRLMAMVRLFLAFLSGVSMTLVTVSLILFGK